MNQVKKTYRIEIEPRSNKTLLASGILGILTLALFVVAVRLYVKQLSIGEFGDIDQYLILWGIFSFEVLLIWSWIRGVISRVRIIEESIKE